MIRCGSALLYVFLVLPLRIISALFCDDKKKVICAGDSFIQISCMFYLIQWRVRGRNTNAGGVWQRPGEILDRLVVERNHGHETAGIRRKRTALLCPRRPGIEHGRSRERHISSYGNLARQKKSVAFEGFASTDRRQAHIYLLTIKGEM